MARSLQNLLPVLVSLGAGTLMCLAGCVVPPPIEPEPPQNNFPPFIDSVEPATPVTQVTSSVISLSVRLFDPNRETQGLTVAWFGEKSDLIKSGNFPLQPTEDLDRGIFYEFGQASHDLSTCGSDLRFEDTETIWVYVSDRRLVFPGDNTVEPEGEDGFVESHSWLLQLDPNRCDSGGDL
jgi:hypothetical protein